MPMPREGGEWCGEGGAVRALFIGSSDRALGTVFRETAFHRRSE